MPLDKQRVLLALEDLGINSETIDTFPDLNDQTIRKHYRKLALIWHPDKSKHEKAEENFKRISAAHEFLTGQEEGNPPATEEDYHLAKESLRKKKSLESFPDIIVEIYFDQTGKPKSKTMSALVNYLYQEKHPHDRSDTYVAEMVDNCLSLPGRAYPNMEASLELVKKTNEVMPEPHKIKLISHIVRVMLLSASLEPDKPHPEVEQAILLFARSNPSEFSKFALTETKPSQGSAILPYQILLCDILIKQGFMDKISVPEILQKAYFSQHQKPMKTLVDCLYKQIPAALQAKRQHEVKEHLSSIRKCLENLLSSQIANNDLKNLPAAFELMSQVSRVVSAPDKSEFMRDMLDKMITFVARQDFDSVMRQGSQEIISSALSLFQQSAPEAFSAFVIEAIPDPSKLTQSSAPRALLLYSALQRGNLISMVRVEHLNTSANQANNPTADARKQMEEFRKSQAEEPKPSPERSPRQP